MRKAGPSLPIYLALAGIRPQKSAQKDLENAQTQFPPSSFSSLPSVGRTEGNEGNEEPRRGI
jgi:hypothetical protein